MRRFLPCLLGLTWLLLPSLAGAAVYDVGSNTSFASFAAAFAAMSADAPGLGASVTLTVNVQSGSYAEALQIPVLPNPIQIIAPWGQSVFLNSGASIGVHVSGVANVRLEGLRLSGSSQTGILAESSPNLVLYRNLCSNNGGTEILIQSCPGAWISDNILAPDTGDALQIQNSANAVLRYNTVQGFSTATYASGITLDGCNQSLLTYNQIKGSITGLQVFNSTGVSVTANSAISYAGSNSTGLYADNSPNLWAWVNLLVGQADGIHIQNSAHCGIHNNSIWNHGFSAVLLASSGNLDFRNNLLQGPLGLDMDGASQASLNSNHNDIVASDHVAIGSSAYPTLGDWQVTGQDAQSLSLDPVFFNSNGFTPTDFQLQAGSPVLGQGANLSSLFILDYFQNTEGPWDIGFHDASSILPATPTPTMTASPILPTSTPTPSFSPSGTPTITPTPTMTATSLTPPPTATPSPTGTPTPYPIQRKRLISYPNPFHPQLGPLHFTFDPAQGVSLSIFDVAMHKVADLPSDQILGSSGYALWDGKGSNGHALPSGLYFAVLHSAEGSRFTRFTLVQ
jgi:parallel beta-helix repeat protein